MRKKYIFIMVMLLTGSFLFADLTAVVKNVSGKVEIKAPGSRWKRAASGMKIKKGYYISTGFRSEAVLVLGTSQVVVRQLTRMELTKLVQKEGTVHTGLNLRVGRVSAKVKTSKGLKQDFKLRSPISTAAVRGTEFEYDGRNLTVYDGTVAFTTPLGQMRLVPAGSGSRITVSGLPQSGEEMAALLANINPSTLALPGNLDISKIIGMLSGLTNMTIVLDWSGSGSSGASIPFEGPN